MKWGFALQSKEIQVDEDLPNFFKSVKLSQADELVLENENMQNNFGICINDPDTISTLNETCIPKKAIQGTPWYQVLSNAKYSSMFYYIGSFVEEREKLIEDHQTDVLDNDGNFQEICQRIRWEQSDMIVLLLNIAYIPDDVVKELDFDPEWHIRFKKLMDTYKEKFNAEDKSSNPENQGLEWKFQDDQLEDRYKKFMSKRQSENKDYQDAIAALALKKKELAAEADGN